MIWRFQSFAILVLVFIGLFAWAADEPAPAAGEGAKLSGYIVGLEAGRMLPFGVYGARDIYQVKPLPAVKVRVS